MDKDFAFLAIEKLNAIACVKVCKPMPTIQQALKSVLTQSEFLLQEN